MAVIVRFAPSPTGPLHLGGARTALFNYLFARQNNGKFILRIDDTDRERSRPEFEADIKEGLQWLSLVYDEFYRQSERTAVYKKYLEKLIAAGKVYQTDVLRFRNPGGTVRFQDIIRGEIQFTLKELGDFVVAKNLTTPLYHFASVVDDYEMKISHIIRGEDHISNTPRQILLCQALGGAPPLYAHLPLILAPDRTKLSKRHGAISVSEYRSQGYLPEALVNFLALLGWSPQVIAGNRGKHEDILNLDTLIAEFSFQAVQKSGAVFDTKKLNWLNNYYLKCLSNSDQVDYLAQALPKIDKETLTKMTPVILDRVHNLAEIKKMKEGGELDYFFIAPKPTKELIKNTAPLPKVIELLEKINETDWNVENIKNAVWDFATEKGRGEVLWPMRVALTGRERSPDPFTMASIIGKRETINRLKHAAQL